MKQTVGVGVIVAVALAAVRYAGPPALGTSLEGPQASIVTAHATKRPSPRAAASAGGCSAYESSGTGSQTDHDPNRGAAKAVLDKFFGERPKLPRAKAPAIAEPPRVRFAVATAPDPRHTNLALAFDREMVLLQEAAQDDGFTYDSSWLPWQSEAAALPLLADQQRSDDQRAAREACPGVLLFRKGVLQPKSESDVGAPKNSSAPSDPSDPYAEGLVVFIVGEQPTGGVNANQWANTMHWLAASPSASGSRQPEPLGILGPTFSGSLPSMARNLAKLYAGPPAKGSEGAGLRGRFPSVHLLSGGVSSCSSILWFQRQLEQPAFGGRVLFGSFAENDDVQIYRFLNFLQSQHTKLKDVAILSEDETAYANPPSEDPRKTTPNEAPRPDRCAFEEQLEDRPVRLSYPRDISAVRAAYDKQAIFNARNASAVRPILKEDPDLESPNDQASDTIHSYSGSLSAIAQEAVLYGIVTALRTHHTRYLMLRCSNPLDFLFLTRFFHQAYPEARVVTVTSDLLFRREIDTTEFRGVFALANYPLQPRNQHWSRLSEHENPAPTHTHRVFDANNEGGYIAGRYLFDSKVKLAAPEPNQSLTLPLLENLPDYADPFWMHLPGDKVTTTQAPVWLSVLGRDGYWPVAVLTATTTPVMPLSAPSPPSTMLKLTSGGAHYDLEKTPRGGGQRFSRPLLFTFPFAWSLSMVLACGLLFYQLFAVSSDSGLTSFGLFAPFRQVKDFRTQAILLGLNSALAAMPALLLFSVVLVAPKIAYVEKMGESYWMWFVSSCAAIVGLAVTLLVHREKHGAPSSGSSSVHEQKVWRLRPDRGLAACVYLLCLAGLSVTAVLALLRSAGHANDAGLFLRMMHLTSGVSPLAPLLLVFLGFYFWTWQALAGNVLLTDGRPRLPAFRNDDKLHGFWNRLSARLRCEPVVLPGEARHGLAQAEYRLSEAFGRRILAVADPLSLDPRVTVLPALMALLAIVFFALAGSLPLLSMEGSSYSVWINLALLFAFLLTTAEAMRFYSTWIELRRLLLALERLRLRRTFARLRAIGQGSLWNVSGSVQRTQTQFFAQQIEAARRLELLIGSSSPRLCEVVECGSRFSENIATKVGAGTRWEKVIRFGNGTSGSMRVVLAEATADILQQLLERWKAEENSLNLICDKELHAVDGEMRASLDLPLSEIPAVRAAEEFVCLQYIAFIQNVLARMRTMVLSMGLLFVSVCLAISLYPFVPRTQIGLWMGADLVLIAASVVYVYAGMERDTTLSYITNTTPGRLGTQFYIKTGTFLAGPILGLLTTQFPAISEFVLGFLQPGLDAIR